MFRLVVWYLVATTVLIAALVLFFLEKASFRPSDTASLDLEGSSLYPLESASKQILKALGIMFTQGG